MTARRTDIRFTALDRILRVRGRGSTYGTAVMPFTFSSTNGIGVGFVTYTLLELVTGKARAVHPLMDVIAVAFVTYFLSDVFQVEFGW